MAKILIVEDEPALQRLYFNVLKRAKYELEVAGDGEEALQKAELFKPDLILLDIIMPKINGIEVLGILKSKPETQGISVIVFTNAYTNKNVESAKALGVTDFLVKSNVEPLYLLERIQALLEARDRLKSPTEA